MKSLLLVILFTIVTFQASAAETCHSAANKANWAVALKLCEELAQQQDAEAQYYLGIMYEWGYGVTEDKLKAVEWLGKSADQNYAKAETDLAYLLERGDTAGIVPKDPQRSFDLYLRAAKQGDSGAEFSIGECYLGHDCPIEIEKNTAKAEEWILKACEHSNWWWVYAAKLVQMINSGIKLEKADGNKLVKSLSREPNSGNLWALGVLYENGTNGLQKNINKAIDYYKKSAARGNTNAPASLERLGISDRFPQRPAKVPGQLSCNTRSFNADCYRTYDNGKKVHFQGSQKWNPLTSQFEFSCGDC